MGDAEFKYRSAGFYIKQIMRAIDASQSGDTTNLSAAVFSFFSGSEYEAGRAANLESFHFLSVINLEELASFFGSHPEVLLKWIETLFYYCRSMSAISEIVVTVWPMAARIVDALKSQREVEGMLASSQLASWDFFYGKANHPSYLDSIKKWKVTSPQANAFRSLLCSTQINLDQPDFKVYAQQCYLTKSYLSYENQAIAIISYYCHLKESAEILDELLCLLNAEGMKMLIKSGNCDFLKGLIGHFYDSNDYKSLLRLLSSMKDVPTPGSSGHGFLLSNGENLTVMTASSRVDFLAKGNYESYQHLIELRNHALNVYVSLLGEPSQDANFLDTDRGGSPPIDDDLSSYRDVVIKHFQLDNDIYDEVSSITLAPSHDFPIQAARFSLGKNAPLISSSLEITTDDHEEQTFVFMLSSHTHTVEVEEKFIRAQFGACAEIYIDPSIEKFIEVMQSEKHSTVYISAHGEYNHWGSGKEDHIVFSEQSTIPGDVLRLCIPKSPHTRNVILNICNGATVEISCNPYSRGLAASIARGNQRVASHLWPVSPIYAASFGMLILHYLKARNLLDATKETFRILSQENHRIIESAQSLGLGFDIFTNFLEGKNFQMNIFKNIGSMAIYS
ncbi:hypothetical protein QF017_006213 [Pseudomonas laurylsulfatiphila]|uniref:hypothetical protein n=1 Tax=Pseudomonas laurylsulfatiphila TaxID=2011015 RepID=UPI003D227B06